MPFTRFGAILRYVVTVTFTLPFLDLRLNVRYCSSTRNQQTFTVAGLLRLILRPVYGFVTVILRLIGCADGSVRSLPVVGGLIARCSLIYVSDAFGLVTALDRTVTPLPQ